MIPYETLAISNEIWAAWDVISWTAWSLDHHRHANGVISALRQLPTRWWPPKYYVGLWQRLREGHYTFCRKNFEWCGERREYRLDKQLQAKRKTRKITAWITVLWGQASTHSHSFSQNWVRPKKKRRKRRRKKEKKVCRLAPIFILQTGMARKFSNHWNLIYKTRCCSERRVEKKYSRENRNKYLNARGEFGGKYKRTATGYISLKHLHNMSVVNSYTVTWRLSSFDQKQKVKKYSQTCTFVRACNCCVTEAERSNESLQRLCYWSRTVQWEKCKSNGQQKV